MKRIFRLFLISAALTGALIVAFLFFDPSLLSTYVLNQITEAATSNALRVSGEDLSLFFIGARIATLRLTIVRLLLPIVLNHVSVDCTGFSVFLGRPECQIAGEAYGGAIEGNAVIDAAQIEIKRASARGLQLAQAPQLMALGLSGGTLDVSTEDLMIAGGLVQNKTSSLVLKSLSVPHQITLSQRLTGLPLPVVIPELTLESAKAVFEGQSVIKNIEVISSFGNVSGSINLKGTIDLTLALSQRGMEQMRPYLQFVCSQAVLDSSTSIQIVGTLQMPRCLSAGAPQ